MNLHYFGIFVYNEFENTFDKVNYLIRVEF